MQQRSVFIDIAKGIGIILVICSHVYYPLMAWSYPFFIPIFFVISGYCTNHIVDLRQKAYKLLIPYFLFSFFLLAIYRNFNYWDFCGVFYARWCFYPYGSSNNIHFLQSGNGPLWFLPSMMTAFVVFRLFRFIPKKWVCGVLFLIVTYILSFCPILLPWSIDTAFLMAFYILIGQIARNYNLFSRINVLGWSGLLLLYIFLAPLCGDINLSVRMFGNSLLLMTITSVIGCVIMICFAKWIEEWSVVRFLSQIGRHSLTIFSLHFPFIGIWHRILKLVGITLPPIGYGILVVLLILLSVYPFSLFVEHFVLAPFQNWCLMDFKRHKE